jgi:hypothetical protein
MMYRMFGCFEADFEENLGGGEATSGVERVNSCRGERGTEFRSGAIAADCLCFSLSLSAYCVSPRERWQGFLSVLFRGWEMLEEKREEKRSAIWYIEGKKMEEEEEKKTQSEWRSERDKGNGRGWM